MRQKRDKSAKTKRGSKKAAVKAPGAPAKRKRKRRTDAAPATSPCAPRLDRQSGAKSEPKVALPAAANETDTATPARSAEQGPIGPAMPAAPNPAMSERRRWPERQGPAMSYGEVKRKAAEARGEGNESGDAPPRANKLVPTNAVHPTERRIKRRLHKNGAFFVAAGAALLGVLILTNQSEPPELVLNERQIASRLLSGQDWQSDANRDIVSEAATRTPEPAIDTGADTSAIAEPVPAERTVAAATPATAPPLPAPTTSTTPTDGLNAGDIFEMQRILARLNLASDDPNGVFTDETADAIRLYQQIAGLPVDGKASPALLADMREVARILGASN